jgi:hypothetical protein
MNIPRAHALMESAFAITLGGSGTYMAVIRPWQEQIEWGGRILLLFLSMISVVLGIWLACRSLRKKP